MKIGILLAVFGSGSRQGEDAFRYFTSQALARFPNIPLRWAFTSFSMRARLASAQRTKSDSVTKALQKMAFERYTHVVVQPLHLLPGLEYQSVLDEANQALPQLALKLSVGAALLTTGSQQAHDISTVAHAILTCVPPQRQAQEPVIFMAHGSKHPSEILYTQLAEAVHQVDPQVHIACMKGSRSLADIAPLLPKPPRTVWLLPLLSLVGNHALHDMAGNSPFSWLSQINGLGFQGRPVLRSLMQNPTFVALWLDHIAQSLAEFEADAPRSA